MYVVLCRPNIKRTYSICLWYRLLRPSGFSGRDFLTFTVKTVHPVSDDGGSAVNVDIFAR